MVKAVVVNRDAPQAFRFAGMLRGAGYVVEICAGPGHDGCPVLVGLPCRLADDADVLVYDADVLVDAIAAGRLIAEVRETYPDLPIVLTSNGRQPDWADIDGEHRVTPVTDSAQIVAAVGTALEDQGMAV